MNKKMGLTLDQARQLLAGAVPEIINRALPAHNRLGSMARLADEIGCHPNTIKNLAYGDTQASGAMLLCLLARFPDLKAELFGTASASPKRSDIARQLRDLADSVQCSVPESVVSIDMRGKIR